MPFDALMTDEERVEVALTEMRTRTRSEQRVTVDRNSKWSQEVLAGCTQQMAMLGQICDSQTLTQMAMALKVIATGESPIPSDCPHVPSAEWRADVLHVCDSCFQEKFSTVVLPVPLVMVNTKYDPNKKGDFRYMIGKFQYMMIPTRMGYEDTWNGSHSLLDELSTLEVLEAKIREIETNANAERDAFDPSTSGVFKDQQ